MSDDAREFKGFLYQKEGKWILADQPNLKSCCLKEEYCTLLGDFSAYQTNVPMTVKGKLHISEQGKYSLSDVKVMTEQDSFHWPYWALALFVIAIVFMRWKKSPLLP